MIGQLTGLVSVIGTGEAIINVGGVGYLVKCGPRTLGGLSIGAPVTLQIETHVREQAITLFGFLDEEERAWFVKLQSVQKVGPKAALAILDIMRPDDILSAVSLEDKTAFSRASGVGPSLAARIVMELSGKAPPVGRGFGADFTSGAQTSGAAVSSDDGSSGQLSGQRGLQKDALSALVNLGIGQSEALRAVASAQRTLGEGASVDMLIKSALKELGA